MNAGNSSASHQRGLRLTKLHAEEILKIYQTHGQSDMLRADDLMAINCAHIIMLKEQAIISESDAASLLKCLREIQNAGIGNAIRIDSRKGDLSTHLEEYIINSVGAEIGGKIHTGRSRNDLYPTIAKMMIRRNILDVSEAIAGLIATLIQMAELHKSTILPGYTHHSQHAQPITLAFFLIGNADVFLRDMDRLADCYNRLNTCPMGAAALATTRFPLNRQRMAELLGFEKVHEHAYDAISAKDFILEYLFSLAMTVSDLGRITESLLYWNTYEFGMIELSDEFTSFSTIMPQKKNPVALETIRAMAPIITGKLFNAFGILKAEPWSNGRETTILDDDYLETGGTVRNLAVLMSSIIKTLRVNDERMLELAKRGFSTATDLADILVSENYFPFRTAHEIVGLCVKKAISQGLDSTGITSEMVEGCIEEHLGRNMPISKDLVRKAMDPRFCVQARNLAGGSAPEEAERMIQERSIMLRNKQSIIQALRERLESAKQELQNEASRFLAMVQK